MPFNPRKLRGTWHATPTGSPIARTRTSDTQAEQLDRHARNTNTPLNEFQGPGADRHPRAHQAPMQQTFQIYQQFPSTPYATVPPASVAHQGPMQQRGQCAPTGNPALFVGQRNAQAVTAARIDQQDALGRFDRHVLETQSATPKQRRSNIENTTQPPQRIRPSQPLPAGPLVLTTSKMDGDHTNQQTPDLPTHGLVPASTAPEQPHSLVAHAQPQSRAPLTERQKRLVDDIMAVADRPGQVKFDGQTEEQMRWELEGVVQEVDEITKRQIAEWNAEWLRKWEQGQSEQEGGK